MRPDDHPASRAKIADLILVDRAVRGLHPGQGIIQRVPFELAGLSRRPLWRRPNLGAETTGGPQRSLETTLSPTDLGSRNQFISVHASLPDTRTCIHRVVEEMPL